MPERAYNVLFHGSHPDEENDDCYYGSGHDSKDEALLAYAAACDDRDIAYIEIDGPDINECRANPSFKPQRRDDNEWRNEIAMQAGMAGGCRARNDALGY